MGFMDNMRDALAAGLRNPGDSAATQREFNERRRSRKEQERLLGAQAIILNIVAEKQREVDARIADQRARGHNVQRDTLWTHATILGGRQALIRYYQNDDPNRVEVFYGGAGSPDGPGHGHIVIRNGQIDFWRTEGNGERLV
ncbi:hypothetical protein [Micromonospora sp. NBC_01796]|uniref:hypothetical protein n=1 Tax=Micromonospora sp. NBC_01796 TaxID=2975987 RepID=UPI002DD9F3A7|nr:hypothetical protein [Micromonospora sp. NBC_01796]WSA86718.1 hypothetical protein OIE47_03570 [Micromonospora sp. NBC_01796]